MRTIKTEQWQIDGEMYEAQIVTEGGVVAIFVDSELVDSWDLGSESRTPFERVLGLE